MSVNMYLGKDTFDIELNSQKNLRMTETQTEWLSQKIESRLGMIIGEWFLNRLLGFPWYTEVLKKNPDLNRLHTLVKAYILEIPEVQEILSLEFTVDNTTRELSGNFKALMTDGEIVEGEI